MHVYIYMHVYKSWYLRASPHSIRQHTSAYIRHTSAYVPMRGELISTRIASLLDTVGIRQHTSAYVSIRQRMSAYVPLRGELVSTRIAPLLSLVLPFPLVSIQHTSAYVSIHASAYAPDVALCARSTNSSSALLHTSAYVSIRQHTSAYTLCACSTPSSSAYIAV